MTATATSKPKTERTIVSTKVTSTGVESTIASSAVGQLERARDLCEMLKQCPQFAEEATAAFDGLKRLIDKTQPTPAP